MYHDTKDKSLLFHFACTLTPGIGPLRFRKIMNYFDSCESAWNSNLETISSLVGQKEATTLKQIISSNKIDALLDSYYKKNIFVVPQTSGSYPTCLKSIPDAPICLFVKSLIDPTEYLKKLDSTISLAVVGSRNHTTYGRVATEDIVSRLSLSNILIVSGLALGIDSIAHITALKNSGKTLAVLGCGVDIIYPPENKYLYENILKSNNCIVSEFVPGTRPSRGSFIARNRIVSGISSGTLIIEGDERSGSLTTAGFAAEQGKDVFAIPGPITSPLSKAPLKLLKSGAYLVTQPEDILEFYKININMTNDIPQPELSTQEKKARDALVKESLFIDDIVIALGFSVQEVANILTKLELRGLIRRDDIGKYHLSSIQT